MEWWLITIMAYCAVTYILGVSIGALYIIFDLLARLGIAGIRVKGGNKVWLGALVYTLFSPVFVPWWIVELIRANIISKK